MADLFAVAGARIFIGAAMAAPSAVLAAGDFSSVSWTEIADWTQCGAFGDAAALITTQVISRGRDVKQKGTFNAGQMQNVFAVNAGDDGQAALIAARASKSNFPFKIEWDDAPDVRSHAATVTIASPGVFTWDGNGLSIGDAIKFSTTGALPTGLTAGTTYYVKTTPDADTFTVSATPGGSAVNTSVSQSGTHTATTVPTGTVDMFVGLVMSATPAGGAANTARLLNSTIEINSNIVTVDPTGVEV